MEISFYLSIDFFFPF